MSIKFAPRPQTRNESQIKANYRQSFDKTKTCRLCENCDMVYDTRFCSKFKKKISQNYRCDLENFREPKRTGSVKK